MEQYGDVNFYRFHLGARILKNMGSKLMKYNFGYKMISNNFSIELKKNSNNDYLLQFDIKNNKIDVYNFLQNTNLYKLLHIVNPTLIEKIDIEDKEKDYSGWVFFIYIGLLVTASFIL